MSPFERVQTFYKANMLKFQLVKKMLTITLDEAQGAKGFEDIQAHQQNFSRYMASSFNCIDELRAFLNQGGSSSQHQKDSADLHDGQVLAYRISKQGKVLLTLAKFADKLLRKNEP